MAVGGDLEIRINTDGERIFRDLGRRIRVLTDRAELNRKLRGGLRDQGRPIVDVLRSRVRGVQVTSKLDGAGRPHYSRQLRERVATAIRMSVAYQGIRFNVESARLGDGKYSAQLPKYLDGELPGYQNWRHPVFGHEPWEVQHGQPWFFVTIREHAADFERACDRVMQDLFEEIARR